MDNQQRSPEQGNVQRLSRMRVGASAPKWWASYMDEDIVCALMKIRGGITSPTRANDPMTCL